LFEVGIVMKIYGSCLGKDGRKHIVLHYVCNTKSTETG